MHGWQTIFANSQMNSRSSCRASGSLPVETVRSSFESWSPVVPNNHALSPNVGKETRGIRASCHRADNQLQIGRRAVCCHTYFQHPAQDLADLERPVCFPACFAGHQNTSRQAFSGFSLIDAENRCKHQGILLCGIAHKITWIGATVTAFDRSTHSPSAE